MPATCRTARARPGRNRWSSWSRRPRPRPSPACWAPTTWSSRRSGHIRDLPRGADEVPAAYKGEAWARLGVDVDNGFKPLYVVSSEKKAQVAKLKALVKQASEVYLATDEDREGESIAWHLCEVLGPPGAGQADGLPRDHPAGHRAGGRRVARSSTAGWSTPRRPAGSSTASTATRCPRSCGRRSCPGCSAGRVQSVATRMVVERERARMAFRSADWWGLDGTFDRRGRGRRRAAEADVPRLLHRLPGGPRRRAAGHRARLRRARAS